MHIPGDLYVLHIEKWQGKKKISPVWIFFLMKIITGALSSALIGVDHTVAMDQTDVAEPGLGWGQWGIHLEHRNLRVERAKNLVIKINNSVLQYFKK